MPLPTGALAPPRPAPLRVNGKMFPFRVFVKVIVGLGALETVVVPAPSVDRPQKRPVAHARGSYVHSSFLSLSITSAGR